MNEGRQAKRSREARWFVFFVFAWLVMPISAEDNAKVSEKLAIQAEKIYTVSRGILTNGLILIEKGKIVLVGPSEKIPANFNLIRAKTVIPGLVDTHTHLGSKSDWNEYFNKEFAGDTNPSLNIMDAIDLESVDFAFALSGGVTTVVVTPGSGNIICGELVIMKTAGHSHQARLLRNPAGLKMAFDLPQALRVVSEEFEKARKYSEEKKKAAEEGKGLAQDPQMEVLLKVLKREIPAHIHCIAFYAIENALKLKKKFNIDIILEHGLEADKLLKEIKEAAVPVSFGPMLLKQAESLPDPIPAALEKAGILFSIHSDAPIVPPNGLLLYAAQAAKYGLSEDVALRAITLGAAEILKIQDRVGSIEPGKDADLVLLDGDPLNVFTHVVSVVLDGRFVYREKEIL